MVFYPSIGDVALICGKAYDIITSFKEAPAEFKAISLEIEDLHSVLEDIKVQSQRSWSPLTRDEQRARNVDRCLSTTNEQLQELQRALEKYNSLGSNAPKLAARARYVTEDFDPIREKLRQRRQELNTQLSLSHSDVLGKILKIVYERAEDERNGSRRSVVCGSEDEDEDAFTVVSQDLQRQNISMQDIDTFKPNIEAYIEELRQIERGPGSELIPKDSVSEVGTNVPALRIPQSSSLNEGLSDLVGQFRGVAIRDVSYRTIFNPHIKSNMVRKPNTFDVWGLAAKCLSLQQKITQDLPRIPEDERQYFESMVRELSHFEPFLILTLADSSTDDEYWSRMQAVCEFELAQCATVLSKNTGDRDYYRRRSRLDDTSLHNLSFDQVGDNLLRLIIAIHNEHERMLNGSRVRNNQSSGKNSSTQVTTIRAPDDEVQAASTLRPPKRGSIFSLRKSRSTGSARSASKNSSLHPFSKSIEMEQKRSGNRPSVTYGPITIIGKTLESPVVWVETLELLCSAFVGTVAGSYRITRSGFESDLQQIVSRWQQDYQSERGARTASSEPEGDSLLVEWLLSIQAIDYTKGRGLSALSRELSFPYQSADGLRYPHGVCMDSWGSVYDARNGCDYISPYLADRIRIHDNAIYAHTVGIVAARYPYIVLEGSKKGLPDGWEARLTDVGKVYYINYISDTTQWERPLEVQRIDSLSADLPSDQLRQEQPLEQHLQEHPPQAQPLQSDIEAPYTERYADRSEDNGTQSAEPPLPSS